MMGRRLQLVGLAVALLLGPVARAQAPALPEVMARLKAYLSSYGEQYAATVATERYRQTSGRLNTVFFHEAQLESDFGIVRVPGQGQWVGFRDVYRVDGRAVQDRSDRLAELFSESFYQGRSRAARIAEESARFNIGSVLRTINNPALALKLLDPDNQFRHTFSKVDEETEAGVRLWVIQFTETVSPTLVSTTEGDDEPSEGRIWVDPVSGRLHRADVSFRSTAADMKSFRARLSVVFREDARLHLWVPVKMTERYEGSDIDEMTGEATYSDYRQFNVDAKEDFK